MSAVLTILDVGHGNSAVIEGPDGVLVIDAGPGGSDLLQYLFDEEIDRVDCVVISHADNDHLRGLLALLEEPSIEIGEVRVNPDAAKLTDIWDDLSWSLGALDREGRVQVFTACTDGDTLPAVDGSVEVHALGPVKELALHGPGWVDGDGNTASSNSCSVVIRVTVNNEHVALLPGDLDLMGLEYIRRAHGDLQAHLMVFPHHGGNVGERADQLANEAFTRDLLEMVRPQSVVFSIGRGRHSTPRPEIVAAVRTFGSDVRISCTQLSERCKEQPLSQTLPHLLDVHARGRSTNSCCAGSLRLQLGGELTPDDKNYEEFKSAEVPSALCR